MIVFTPAARSQVGLRSSKQVQFYSMYLHFIVSVLTGAAEGAGGGGGGSGGGSGVCSGFSAHAHHYYS